MLQVIAAYIVAPIRSIADSLCAIISNINCILLNGIHLIAIQTAFAQDNSIKLKKPT